MTLYLLEADDHDADLHIEKVVEGMYPQNGEIPAAIISWIKNVWCPSSFDPQDKGSVNLRISVFQPARIPVAGPVGYEIVCNYWEGRW